MKTVKAICLWALSGIVFLSCGEKNKEAQVVEMTETAKVEVVEEEMAEPNIVEVAGDHTVFTTLIAALKAGDLAETLSGDGPFTVFAPTNDAFAKLPEETLKDLLNPENKEVLTDILTYHVVSSEYKAAALIEAINNKGGTFTVTTVQGETIDISLKDGKVQLKDAKGSISTVAMADVLASNGVIHALDTVLTPE